MLSCLFVISATNARAEYQLAAGDVVEITVFGVQGLTKRTTVDVDGNVSMPLLGRVHATGQSLAGLRDLLQARAAAEAVTRGADVAVDLVQCRPFYISGDVKNSGAYPYVPGLTVRQAMAVAGGVAGKSRSEIPPGYTAEVRARFNALLLEEVAGLRAEADGTFGPPAANLWGETGQGNAGATAFQLEARRFEAYQNKSGSERASFERMIVLVDDEIRTLEAQLKQDGVAVDAQSQEVARVQDLQSRGLSAASRASEEWRALVLLKSRQMETAARLAAARPRQEDLRRNLNKIGGERRVEVLQMLQDIITDLEKVRAQMNGEAEKLALLGIAVTEGLRGESDPLQVVIYRRGAAGGAPFEATADAPVEPGDAIEVKMMPFKATGVSGEIRMEKAG
jgi:polysaccharide export outer membrane protein